MNKTEMIAKIAEKTNTSRKAAAEMFDAFVETVTEALKEGDSVQIIGFGTFEVKERPARTGRNPAGCHADDHARSLVFPAQVYTIQRLLANGFQLCQSFHWVSTSIMFSVRKSFTQASTSGRLSGRPPSAARTSRVSNTNDLPFFS